MGEGSNVCPTCMATYPGGVTTCSADGTMLVPAETFAFVDKDLAVGTTVGEYRIEGKLGEGGFGAVFRGVHPVIGKTAAIKVLGREFSSSPQMVSRFIAEARAVNQIRHRNIIDIFSFGQLPDGRQYYVMELLDGTPFDRYLKSHGRLSFRQSLPILRGIARALDAAHGKDILHRDLKPENVYLVFDEDGGVLPKLLDFGLVKLLTESSGSHKTKTGTPMGTPYYMSPEQCRGHEVDRRTDVYSFGVMVYEVLTGTLPFMGETAMDILLKHITVEATPPSTVCSDVPPALDAPVLKMLAKDAKDRPSTVGEALERMLAAASQAGLMAGESSPALPPPAPISASYQAAATIPAVTVTGAVGGGAPVASISTSASGGVKVVTGGQAPDTSASARANTFLASEADVTATKPSRSKAFAGVAMAGLALAVGGAIWFTMTHSSATGKGAGLTPASSSAVSVTPVASSAAVVPEVASAPAPPAEIAVTVENAPAGATISIDGKEPVPLKGPVKVKRGVEAKLTIAAKGFKPKDLPITATDDTKIDGALVADKQPVKGNAGAAGAKGLNKDLMDPFGNQ
ncbi:MAG: protein kinase [Deltaproteobacteria bacterium]|nr:protein kinase [Deltaproteobacteria bacterium]